MKVRYWTSRNDVNHSNRHAEVMGVEFFAFPNQSLYARIGNRSAKVSDALFIGGEKCFSATQLEADSKHIGNTIAVDHKRFPTQDEAIVWAAEWVKAGAQ